MIAIDRVHEQPFSNQLEFGGNVRRPKLLAPRQGLILEEDTMKLRFTLAAIVAAAIAVPTIASAETFVVKNHGDRDHFRGVRNEMRVDHDRGLHRGWFHDRDHGNKTVIIKRHGDRD
jgi:hypothetical protein